jgi:GrpB-like predicted nucleotidyltransferase (UPF0157 family)
MTIADADERWAEIGRTTCALLAERLPGTVVEVEHVGSTSVPGLAAKPVIDLMASVRDLDAARTAAPELAELGFRLVSNDMPERLFLQRFDPDGTAFHLHIVTAESWPTRNERLLRDHLRAHPADRDRYAALKRELMDRLGPGEAYTRGKTALIQELTDKARAARGLPSVPVWED